MSDDTGYGKPPQHTRFRKGVSGNPKGRPKGSLNVSTVLWRQLRTKIEVEENGARKVMTKPEASMMRLVNKTANGDLVALRYLTSLVTSLPTETQETKSKEELSETDQKLMTRVLEKLQQSEKGRANDKD